MIGSHPGGVKRARRVAKALFPVRAFDIVASLGRMLFSLENRAGKSACDTGW